MIKKDSNAHGILKVSDIKMAHQSATLHRIENRYSRHTAKEIHN